MTMTIGHQLLSIGLGACAIMIVAWLVQFRTKDAGIVDVAWAGSLGASAVYAGLSGGGDPIRCALVGLIGGIWGARLALHLLVDRVLAGPEDGRYQMMRERLGPRINPALFLFFQAQAVLVVVLCVPFLIACADPRAAPDVWDIAGAALWVIGIAGESLADRQLKRFKARPDSKGRVCDVGLWRYSRHPNYFFEWLMWCAYAIIALPAAWGWVALSGPALILFFVLKVTGIPPTEARAIRSRGEAYRRYQRTTSAFFPWFPKEPST